MDLFFTPTEPLFNEDGTQYGVQYTVSCQAEIDAVKELHNYNADIWNQYRIVRFKAWITFFDEDYENDWHPVNDVNGNHMDFDERDTYKYCQMTYPGRNWGIAEDKQKELGNAQRDNF